MEDWLDSTTVMTDAEFMRMYRDPYQHSPVLKAGHDQDALKTRYSPTAGAPTGEAAKVEAEKRRRGLTYPESWIAAGLVAPPTATTIK